MMVQIVNFTNKHVFLGFFVKIAVYIALKLISLFQHMSGNMRKWFHLRTEHGYIRQLKGKYHGKRCFIICTGPSLTIEDLEKLKGEYTFGMNSMCLIYEKMDFRPTFYSCIDKGVFMNVKEKIYRYDTGNTIIFIASRIRRTIRGKLHKNWFNISCNAAYHTYDRYFKGRFWCKFSDDAEKGIYDMYSVTHFLIQIAVYMGFKEIYLLGADCSFPKNGKLHFVEHGTVDKTIDSARERNLCGYEEVKIYAEGHGVKVYNVTRGGELEVFERVNFDDVCK